VSGEAISAFPEIVEILGRCGRATTAFVEKKMKTSAAADERARAFKTKINKENFVFDFFYDKKKSFFF
jgi:hypothetical protein